MTDLDLALNCAILSDLVYEDFGSDKFDKMVRNLGSVIWSTHAHNDSEAALFDMGVGNIYIAFRGTEADSISDWFTDVLLIPVDFRSYGNVHLGFFNALNDIRADIITDLLKLLKNYRDIDIIPRIFVTGHSLGAAMATLFCMDLLDIGIKISKLYTFGSPRVGDEDFCDNFDGAPIRHDRYVNNNDIVAHLPSEYGLALEYRHCGTLNYFKENGELVINPGWLSQTIESIKGIVGDIGELGLDAFKDHALRRGDTGYIPFLKRLKDEQDSEPKS